MCVCTGGGQGNKITKAARIRASSSDLALWRVRKESCINANKFSIFCPYIHPWRSTLKPQECFELDFPLNPHRLAVQLAWATPERRCRISSGRVTRISTWSVFNSSRSRSALHRYWNKFTAAPLQVWLYPTPDLSANSSITPNTIWQWCEGKAEGNLQYLTSICLNQINWSVLFNLCVIWNPQAWRTEDETKCLLSCKYCKWNLDVPPYTPPPPLPRYPSHPGEAFPITEG